MLKGLVGLGLMLASAIAAAYPQPYISSFSPTSGPAGTEVTIIGRGFTGLNQAWVGKAHDARLSVVNDGKVRVWIPASGTTGAIGILNPASASFTAQSFTVRSSTTPPPSGSSPPPSGTTTTPGSPPSSGSTATSNPWISNFSPTSGPVGTVVTINGTGFTGLNQAWAGNAHDAGITVVSSTQVKVTIPADATTGAIGILNGSAAAFTAQSFTLTPGSTPAPQPAPAPAPAPSPAPAPAPAPAPTPTAGAPSISTQGNRFVNASGQTVQLRGVNYSGYEFAAIGGWSGSDPSGGQAGQAGGPKWSAILSWKANVVRIPLNEASWLGYTCVDTNGTSINPDPAGNYQSSVKTQVAQALAAGLYVIVDLHWTAPGNACPMLQGQMADADHSLAFWTSVANAFKANPGVMFELFNEPFMNFDFSGDTWSYMMKGTNGSFSGYPATSNNGNWKDVKQPWAIASYQAMIDAVRATGARNVVLVGTMQYAQEFSGWLSHRPTDPLNQMAAVWHPYPTYGTTWGTAAYAQPNYAPEVYSQVQALLDAGIPVVATETGDRNTAGTSGAPLVSNITAWADAHGIGLLGWAWDVWGDANNVLIKDVNGTPTDGYGVVFRDWLMRH